MSQVDYSNLTRAQASLIEALSGLALQDLAGKIGAAKRLRDQRQPGTRAHDEADGELAMWRRIQVAAYDAQAAARRRRAQPLNKPERAHLASARAAHPDMSSREADDTIGAMAPLVDVVCDTVSGVWA